MASINTLTRDVIALQAQNRDLLDMQKELATAARDMLTVWDGVADPALAYPEGSPAARLRDLIAKTTQA